MRLVLDSGAEVGHLLSQHLWQEAADLVTDYQKKRSEKERIQVRRNARLSVSICVCIGCRCVCLRLIVSRTCYAFDVHMLASCF